MKKTVRIALTAALAVLFAVGLAGVLRSLAEDRRGARDYADAAQAAGLSDLSAAEAGDALPDGESPAVDPYAEELKDTVDLAALRQVNPEVLGWIVIPDTGLSYPLLQGEDNDYYLDHTWSGDKNAVGAIFMDCRNSADLSDSNTIVYGHRMNNSAMFGYLRHYQDADYWASHPRVYLVDDNGVHIYEIFAMYEASVTAGSTYRVRFADDGAMQAFLDEALAQSAVDTGVVPAVRDRILTLSTCTGTGHATRWVVQAALRQEIP